MGRIKCPRIWGAWRMNVGRKKDSDSLRGTFPITFQKTAKILPSILKHLSVIWWEIRRLHHRICWSKPNLTWTVQSNSRHGGHESKSLLNSEVNRVASDVAKDGLLVGVYREDQVACLRLGGSFFRFLDYCFNEIGEEGHGFVQEYEEMNYKFWKRHHILNRIREFCVIILNLLVMYNCFDPHLFISSIGILGWNIAFWVIHEYKIK